MNAPASASGLLPVTEARARMLAGISATEFEAVALSEAGGRILARDLKALRTQPPFANSAMDGYAVRAADVRTAPAQLEVIGTSVAGRRFDGTLGAGQAVRIFTGAPLPPGANAIVIQENVSDIVDHGMLEIIEAAEEGQFVRPEGLDFHEGETGLIAGVSLSATQIALAAAMGHASLPVRRRPRIAIMSTGDELVEPGEPCGPDQINCSNAYGLSVLVAHSGGEAMPLGIAPDDPKVIAARITDAMNANADVIVTTGGASVGDHDHMQAVLRDLGADMAFWKIAMRPGKPMIFGTLGQAKVLGLPGNPVSSMVCARLFLVPLIRAFLGHNDEERPLRGTLSTPLPANGNREDYVRARLHHDEDGRWGVTPFSRQDSSMIATLAHADALVIRPIGADPAPAGTCVSFLPVDPRQAQRS